MRLRLLMALGALLVFSVTVLLLWSSRQGRPTVVLLGDSLTSCGGQGGHYSDWLVEYLPEARIVDAGIGGDTLEGGRRRFRRDVLEQRPAVLLIALGANDFWRNKREVSEMAADLEAMVSAARAQRIEVIVASCFGERDFWQEVCTEFDFWRFALAERIALMEQDICRRYGCIYLANLQPDIKPNRLPPFWDETDHPNKRGNREVALHLLPSLREALQLNEFLKE